MKQTTDLRQDALKWFNKFQVRERESICDKYFIIETAAYLTDEQIEHIYEMEVIAMRPIEEIYISKDSLEDKKYWTPGGMVDGYGLRCTDGRELIKQEAFNGLENEQTRVEILTALNNYNALKNSCAELTKERDDFLKQSVLLKQINKELIEALYDLVIGTTSFDEAREIVIKYGKQL